MPLSPFLQLTNPRSRTQQKQLSRRLIAELQPRPRPRQLPLARKWSVEDSGRPLEWPKKGAVLN